MRRQQQQQQRQRHLSMAGAPGLGGLLCFAQPVARGGLALWPRGPWPLDRRRRATVRLRSARSAAARQQQQQEQIQEASGDAMHRRGGSCRRCCASAVPRVLESHDGDGKGAGRWGSRRTMDCSLSLPASAWRAGVPGRGEGERGELCIDYCKCVRAYQCKCLRGSSPGARSI